MRSLENDVVIEVISFDASIVSARSLRKILEILSHQAGSIAQVDSHTLERS